MSDLIGKVERRAGKTRISQEMNSLMDKRRKRKNVNKDEGRKNRRRFRNELIIGSGKDKSYCLERICDKITEFPRRGCNDVMYMKTKERGYSGYSKHCHQRLSREYAIVDQSCVIRFWENYTTELNDRAN